MTEDTNKILSLVSSIIGVITFLYISFRTIIFWIQNQKLKIWKKGIYRGYWIDPHNEQINIEILRLRKSIKGISIRPIYLHKAKYNYIFNAEPFLVDKYILWGQWKSVYRKIWRGYAMFHFDEEKNKFEGKWLGPRKDRKINGGEWILEYISLNKNQYFKSKLIKQYSILKERIFREDSIIDDIIKKHESFTQNNVKIDNIILNLNKDSFIPTLGKISIPMIKYVSSIVNENDKVLDLGTGTGFYPIYLAKNNKCHSLGIDISSNLITLAKNNSSLNNVSDLNEFRLTDPNDIFKTIDKSEKFDYIIANLPFSKLSKTIKSKKSRFYHSFSSTYKIIVDLILGSQYYIKPEGKLIFCFGESGYVKLLEDLVEISSWNYLKEVKKIESKDETFYIYELELSHFVKKKYLEFKKSV